jgi:hypothetical protein
LNENQEMIAVCLIFPGTSRVDGRSNRKMEPQEKFFTSLVTLYRISQKVIENGLGSVERRSLLVPSFDLRKQVQIFLFLRRSGNWARKGTDLD